MDRRDFLKSTGGLAAVATGCALPSVATAAVGVSGAGRRLTFSFPWAASPAGYADDALRLARRIEVALAGAVTFDLRPASTQPADFALAPAASDAALHPAFAYFGGLPGCEILAPADLEAWLLSGGGQDLWDDLASAHRFKPLLAGHSGGGAALWSRVRVQQPQDLAGLRVVARGLDADIVRALGGIPLAGDERQLEAAVSAPDTGAVIWGSLVHASAAGLPARFPFALVGALGSAGGSLVLKIGLDVWNSLTAAERAAVTAAAAAEFRLSLTDIEMTRAAVRHAITARFAASFEAPSSEFEAAVSRIAAAVVAHTAAHDAIASRIDRSYTAFRRVRSGDPVA